MFRALEHWEGGVGIFGHFLDRFFSFCAEKFGFSVLVTIAVSSFCSISVSVFGKNKIGFSDLLFDARWCFSGFSSENMRLNNLNRVHIFSDFAYGFDRFCGFLLLFVPFCGF